MKIKKLITLLSAVVIFFAVGNVTAAPQAKESAKTECCCTDCKCTDCKCADGKCANCADCKCCADKKECCKATVSDNAKATDCCNKDSKKKGKKTK